MATVKDVWNLLDRKAPFRTQMDFDNAGFLVGRGDQQVTRVLVALDITPEVIREAAEKGCQLILAHHPVIWGKVGQITDETADTTICTVKSSAHMKNSFDDANRFNIPCTGVTERTGSYA